MLHLIEEFSTSKTTSLASQCIVQFVYLGNCLETDESCIHIESFCGESTHTNKLLSVLMSDLLGI